MGAAAKYTLGRLGLFVVVVLALLPVDINLFLKLILALAFSAALSFFLLRGWRDEMAQEMADAADRRKVEKERLRSALAGDDSADAAADQADQTKADQPKQPKGKGKGDKSES
ncbi:hypothetical protein GCM10027280_15020 [Micromonospora polyrhachis]|uniref:DUF4229 domain-containing protein n=1 Tax=Micromonospora polyrhachis TaxID=1282883 RepID=A0A7W7WP74_9ACTN|nr:DUF4229 domain-containing protein [Micromonospora polyrhachis]MBB4958610.1 hypothetical protein [Micromonospora polyrhachis]